jgi:hypothetical protein
MEQKLWKTQETAESAKIAVCCLRPVVLLSVSGLENLSDNSLDKGYGGQVLVRVSWHEISGPV